MSMELAQVGPNVGIQTRRTENAEAGSKLETKPFTSKNRTGGVGGEVLAATGIMAISIALVLSAIDSVREKVIPLAELNNEALVKSDLDKNNEISKGEAFRVIKEYAKDKNISSDEVKKIRELIEELKKSYQWNLITSGYNLESAFSDMIKEQALTIKED